MADSDAPGEGENEQGVPAGGPDPQLDPAPMKHRVRPTARSLVPAGELGWRGKGLKPRERAAVLDELFFEGDRRVPYLWRFATLTVLSTTIATFGMLNDSSAVVIGAMLVAPLMTPMLGISASIVQAWPRRQLDSLATLGIGPALAVGTAFLLTIVVPGDADSQQLPAEVLSRTSPNILDLGIAVAAGAAGAYILMRKEAGAALPGVAIAVALVPPLAAIGITLGVGDTRLAGGATLLYVTNFAAIVLAAALVFVVAGFVADVDRIKNRRVVRFDLGVVIALVVAVSVPLLLHSIRTYHDGQLAEAATDAVHMWDPSLRVADVDPDTGHSPADVEVTVVGPTDPGDAGGLAAIVAAEYGSPVEVTVAYVKETVSSGSSSATTTTTTGVGGTETTTSTSTTAPGLPPS